MIKQIIILVSGFWFLASGIFAMDIDLWNLAQIPESEVIWKDKPLEVNGIVAATTHLRCQLLADKIIEFYKETLTKDKWELKEHYPKENVLVLTKEGRFFYVVVMYNGHDLPCDVYLVNSPADLAICKSIKDYFLQEELVAADTPGKDFSDIPRYPGSKRRLNIFTPFYGAGLIYEVEAKPQEVAQFYRQNLKASGWQEDPVLNQKNITRLAPQLKDIALLHFYRGEDSLFINVMPVPGNLQSKRTFSVRSLISIVKNIEQEMVYPGKGDK